LSRFLAL